MICNPSVTGGYRRNDSWQRFCYGLGARPVRAGSIGRDTPGHAEFTELPPQKAGGVSPRSIHEEIGAL